MLSYRNLAWTIPVCALLAARAALPVPQALGQQPAADPDYSGLDVVFLVDQSGSMGGLRYGSTVHPEPNDPNDLRFSGLRQMVERLASYRANYFHGSQVRFQIAVVYFGSTSEVVLPPRVIALEKGERLPPDALSPLAAEHFQRNLENTDHLAALRKGKQILDEMQASWRGGPHLQAILMLTDGESYLGCANPENGAGRDYCAGGHFNADVYRQEVTRFLRQELPYPRYRFYVGGINDRSEAHGPAAERQWQDWTHHNARWLKADSMWSFFEGALGELTINQDSLKLKMPIPGKLKEVPESENSIVVPPFLQELEFIVHKPDAGTRIRLFEDGQELAPGSAPRGEVTVTDRDLAIESILIHRPQPGVITIRRPPTADILRIFTRELGIGLACDPVPPVVPLGTPVPIRCSFREPLPAYDPGKIRLVLDAEIVEGDGATARLTLAGKGEAFAATYGARKLGPHKLTVVASSWTPAGSGELFRQPPAQFTVRHVRLARAAVLLPRAGSAQPWRGLFWSVAPLEIEAAVVDAAGAALQPAQFLRQPAGGPPLQVAVVSPEGRSFPVTLRPSALPGRYRGSFRDYAPFRWLAHPARGWYEVRAHPAQPGGLLEGWVWGLPPTAAARVHLVRHPLWWLLPGTLALGLAALTGLGIRRTWLGLWSIPGSLLIESAGMPWQRRLGDYRRHTVVFTGRRDALPAGVRRMVLQQRRGRNQPLLATVELARGARITHNLMDGARKPIGEGLQIGYERGSTATERTRAALSLPVALAAIVTVCCATGLAGVIRALISSLA